MTLKIPDSSRKTSDFLQRWHTPYKRTYQYYSSSGENRYWAICPPQHIGVAHPVAHPKPTGAADVSVATSHLVQVVRRSPNHPMKKSDIGQGFRCEKAGQRVDFFQHWIRGFGFVETEQLGQVHLKDRSDLLECLQARG